MDETAGPVELEIESWEAPDAARALGRALLWTLGIGVAAGAAAGFAFLFQNDEFRGASILLAVVGAVVGAVFALLPALYAALVVALAAQRSRTARTYRRWVTATVATLAILVPVLAVWVYRSFSYDLRDDNRSLAAGTGAALVVAEVMLIPMWQSLKRVRVDEPGTANEPSAIPNPFAG